LPDTENAIKEENFKYFNEAFGGWEKKSRENELALKEAYVSY